MRGLNSLWNLTKSTISLGRRSFTALQTFLITLATVLIIFTFIKSHILFSLIDSNFLHSIAETKGHMLLNNGFMRTVTELSLKNLKDPEFCQKSSYLLSAVSTSFYNSSRVAEFFSQIKRFELITALLLDYRSNDSIYINVLTILNFLLKGVRAIKFTKDELEMFFDAGALGYFLVDSKTSSNNSVVMLSNKVVYYISESKPFL